MDRVDWLPWALSVFAGAIVVALMALLMAPTLLAARALLVGAGALLAAAAVPLVYDWLALGAPPPPESNANKIAQMHPRRPG